MEDFVSFLLCGLALTALLLFSLLSRRINKSTKEAGDLQHFDKMPGPKSYPIIGTLHLYFTGKYSMDRLHWNGLKKFKEYGWIVRETIVPGVDLVWLFDPKDIRKLFLNEGKYPSRRSHTALGHYRRSHPDKYTTEGLLPTNGEEWRRIRTLLQKPVVTSLATSNLVPQFSFIAQDFVAYLEKNLDMVSCEDFLPHLNKLFMEITGFVTFDTRLDCLHHPLDDSSIAARLIRAAEETNSRILETDNGIPLWKIWETKSFRIIRESQEFFEKVSESFIRKKKNTQSLGEEKTLLDNWLCEPGLGEKDIMTGVCEFLLAGVHTSSYTFSFLLYHLAKNPQVQERLRRESIELKQTLGSHIDRSWLSKAVYAKACLKESLRLNPVSVGIGRILPHDTELGGYLVPKGTVVVTQNQVICRFSQFFKSPDSFTPERWISECDQFEQVDPFISQPFGYGPRQCIGKNIAEASLLVLLVEMVTNFSWEWADNGELDSVSHLINKPDKPVLLKFSKVTL